LKQKRNVIFLTSQMRRIKLWEDEKSVIEEGLATLDRVHQSYRDRLAQIENNLQFSAVAQPDVNVAQTEAVQVRFLELYMIENVLKTT
jgi:hypothetical protein